MVRHSEDKQLADSERKKHWEYILKGAAREERVGTKNRNRIPTLALEADSCGIDGQKEVR